MTTLQLDVADAPLARFSAIAHAALGARNLGELVNAACDALGALGMHRGNGDALDGTIRQALRLAVQRVATGAGPETEISRLRRLIVLGGARGPARGELVDVWMEVLRQGTSGLRSRYLQSLVEAAHGSSGDTIVFISDLSGTPLPVRARGTGKRPTASLRVQRTAAEISAAVCSACSAPGVFCVGRLRITRLDRPSRTLLEGVVDTQVSPTGLAAIVVRAHQVLSSGETPILADFRAGGCRVGLPAYVALKVAG